MRKVKKKLQSNSSSVEQTTQVEANTQALEEYEGFRVGETVWFNTSLVCEKYSCGEIKEILLQKNGVVAICIWDCVKKVIRAFCIDKLFRVKPIKKRKPRTKRVV